MSKKILFRLFINTLIGLILIFIWLKIVNFDEIWQTIVKINFFSLFPVIFFLFLANFFRSIRLKMLLTGFKIRLSQLILVNHLSQLLSFSIPIRAGEITKGVYISSQTGHSFAKSVIWILIDRFLDFWVLIIISVILLLAIPNALPQDIIRILLVMVTGSSVLFIFIVLHPRLIKTLSEKFKVVLVHYKLKNWFTRFVDFILDCSDILRQGVWNFTAIILLTFASLVLDTIPWLILFNIVSGDNFSFASMFLGQQLTALTYLIPAAPGYVGSAEASGLLVFHYTLGYGEVLTSSVTVLLHALTLIYILLFGLIGFYMLKFDLNIVWKMIRKQN